MADLDINNNTIRIDSVGILRAELLELILKPIHKSTEVKKENPKLRMDEFRYPKRNSEILKSIKEKVRFILTEKIQKSDRESVYSYSAYDPASFQVIQHFPFKISKRNKELLQKGFANFYSLLKEEREKDKRKFKNLNEEKQGDLGQEEIIFIYRSLGVIGDNDEDNSLVMDFFALNTNGTII